MRAPAQRGATAGAEDGLAARAVLPALPLARNLEVPVADEAASVLRNAGDGSCVRVL